MDGINIFLARANHIVRSRTFLVGVLGGLVGVLVDADHLVAYFIFHWSKFSGRFLHIPIFIVVCIVLICMVAYLARLYLVAVLRNRNAKKQGIVDKHPA